MTDFLIWVAFVLTYLGIGILCIPIQKVAFSLEDISFYGDDADDTIILSILFWPLVLPVTFTITFYRGIQSIIRIFTSER